MGATNVFLHTAIPFLTVQQSLNKWSDDSMSSRQREQVGLMSNTLLIRIPLTGSAMWNNYQRKLLIFGTASIVHIHLWGQSKVSVDCGSCAIHVADLY